MVEIASEKKSIFKSRLWLIFKDSELENNYQVKVTKEDFLTSIYFSTICILYSICNLTIPHKITSGEVYILNIITYNTITFNFGILLSSIIITKAYLKLNFSLKIIKNVFTSINFISFILNIFYAFTYIDFKNNFEEISLITNLITFVKLVACQIIFKNYILVLINMTILLAFEILIIVSISDWNFSIVIINFILTNIFTIYFAYSNEASEKINYFINNEILNSYKCEKEGSNKIYEILNLIKSPIINLDNSSNIHFLNEPICNLITTFQDLNYPKISEEKNDENFNNNLKNSNSFLEQNKFNMYKNNFIPIEKSNQKENKILFNTKELLEQILSNIIFVNEELSEINNNLYIYLNKIQYSKLKNFTDKEKEKFNFEKFILLLHQIKTKIEKEKEKPEEINTISINNNTEIVDLIGNEKKYSILKIKKEEEIISNPILINSQEVRHFYLCNLKLISLQNKFIEKELSVFITYNNSHINFTFEDNALLRKIERQETMKICKSLYLAKISHEFKNPICNLLENFSTLNSALQEIEKESPNLLHNNSIKEESSCGSSDSDDTSKSIIEFKPTKKISSFFRNVKNNISNSKCMIEIMQQITNDLIFYSTSQEDGVYNSPKPYNSNNKINSPNSKNSPTRKLSGKITFSNKYISLVSENSNKFLNLLKFCNYKEIVENVINTLTLKSCLDNKSPKLVYKLNFAENLPEQIEIDSAMFKSLFFNILFHLSKSVTTGIVKINIFENKQKNLSTNLLKQIDFEILVVGLIRNVNDNEDLMLGYEEEVNNSRTRKQSEPENNLGKSSIALTSFSFENYHLKKIFNSSNNVKRNLQIDNFNNKFHYYLSILYSKKLGINLNYDFKNQKETKITFSLKYSEESVMNCDMEINNIKFSKTCLEGFGGENQNRLNILSRKNSNKRGSSQTSQNKYRNTEIVSNSVLISESNNSETKILENENSPITKRTDIYNGKLEFNYLQFIEQDKIIEEHCRKSAFKKNISYNFGSSKNISNNFGSSKNISNNFGSSKNISNNLESSKNILNQFGSKKNVIPITKLSEKLTRRSNGSLHKPLSEPNVTNPISYGKLIGNKNVSENKEKDSPLLCVKNNLPKAKRLSVFVSGTRIENFDIFNPSVKFVKKLSNMNQSLKMKAACSNSSSNLNNSFREKSKFVLPDDSQNVFRILLCDDESLIRKTQDRFFKSMSEENPNLEFDVQHAADGFQCLEAIYRYIKTGKYFDMLIIDETMPFFKGSQVTHLLKSAIDEGNISNMTIVSFTSYNTQDKIDYIMSQGADFILHKPIKYEEFKAFFIRSFLQQMEILQEVK